MHPRKNIILKELILHIAQPVVIQAGIIYK
jgi:hypothetical protein